MKLAVLGSGNIVSDFLRISGDLKGLELKAIFGIEQELDKMKNLQETYGISKVYTVYEECLNDEEVDTVYVGLPNHLHYSFAKEALLKGKNVICEKPFTIRLAELLELKELAKEKNVIIVEAITTLYLSNYQVFKDLTTKIGDLKIVECNYSQYSSRYNAFKEGEALPAFNPKAGGGALMDINIYNIHFVVGILGRPNTVQYIANLEREVDTSGVLILEYDNYKAVCIGSKETVANNKVTFQGTEATVTMLGSANLCNSIEWKVNRQEGEIIDEKVHKHRMYEEFCEFIRMVDEKDVDKSFEMMEHSQIVLETVEKALVNAGIKLG